MSEYLGMNLEAPFATNVQAIGEGSTDGSTRKKLVLSKALEAYPDQAARPVWVWPQMDKLSSAWLLALPGPQNGLTSAVFSEAMCMNLCLPSPACRDQVGEIIGRTKVDQFGDKVMSAHLPGDSWRIRHDTVKIELNRLFMWRSMRATCEGFG